jgi:hypothetical protein
MSSYGGRPDQSFLGLVLLQVERDSFEELGRVTHTSLARSVRADQCASDAATYPCGTPEYQDWRAQIVRSIVMDDLLVSISNLGIQVNPLARPERTIARLLLVRPPVRVAN